MTRILIQGDPMEPCSGDLIAELGTLPVGEPVPEGWRVLSGNMKYSQIGRVVMRCEIEEQANDPL